MNNFRNLEVWKKGMDLVASCYELTLSFPSEERFGLVSQIRRSAVSIPANIAEGAGRNSQREFQRFCSISLGSVYELETLVTLSANLGLVNQEVISEPLSRMVEIQKMLHGLMKSLDVVGT